LTLYKGTAESNAIIYTYGFVSSDKLSGSKKDDESDQSGDGSIEQKILLFFLTIISLIIQTVVPVAIDSTLSTPDGLCPNQANPLTKFIGFTLCLFFVVLTISLCLGKLRGLGFLKLFCSSDVKLLGWNRFLVDLGVLSNMISMGAAGIAQYLLFIRNADKDYVLLLLQSLAMQFVLTCDEKLMMSAWKSWTKKRLAILMRHDRDKLVKEEEGIVSEQDGDVVMDESVLMKVKLMYLAEASFLAMVSTVGIVWSIALAYCM